MKYTFTVTVHYSSCMKSDAGSTLSDCPITDTQLPVSLYIIYRDKYCPASSAGTQGFIHNSPFNNFQNMCCFNNKGNYFPKVMQNGTFRDK